VQERERVEAVIDLEAALSKLTDKQRFALTRWVLGYTQAEIAAMMGIAERNVRALIARAEDVLREPS